LTLQFVFFISHFAVGRHYQMKRQSAKDEMTNGVISPHPPVSSSPVSLSPQHVAQTHLPEPRCDKAYKLLPERRCACSGLRIVCLRNGNLGKTGSTSKMLIGLMAEPALDFVTQ
jgi:hypothetical protein